MVGKVLNFIGNLFVKIVFLIWEFPQKVIGFFMTIKPKAVVKIPLENGETIKVYFTKNVFGCGVSLSNYIILNYDYYFPIINTDLGIETALHEYGHSRQSKYLGWFYFLVVGIPSAAGNIYDRVAHRGLSYSLREKWYYSRFPENWADKLGGVERFKK